MPGAPDGLRITFLAEKPEAIQILVGWFFQEWPEYFEGKTVFEMGIGFSEACKTQELDIALLALLPGDQIAGTVTLSATAPEDYQGQQWPWITGLFVNPMFRGQGIGRALVASAIKQSSLLKFPAVYAGTLRAAGLFEDLGFDHIETADLIYQELPIFRKVISTPS